MAEIDENENFIIQKLLENDKVMSYKDLQTICEDKFEGLRLILKKLKDKGIIDFDGPIPGFSSEITLYREP